MDKKEFLSELEKSLSVLQEDELRDIVSEYEQHIDIKTEKGLTEAEAIADFGSLQELTAEILEAYHVRADYAEGTKRSRKKQGKNPGQDGPENFEKLREIGERGSLTLRGGMKRAGRLIISVFHWGWRQLRRPFVWFGCFVAKHNPWHEKTNEAEAEMLSASAEDMSAPGMRAEEHGEPERVRNSVEAIMTGAIRKRKGDKGMASGVMVRDRGKSAGEGIRAISRGISRIFRWGMEAVLWGIRLVWNGCWVMFSFFAGGFGLISLFGTGLLAVLLIEGYPLAGVMIGCMGLVLCMFSAAGLGLTLMWRKPAGEAVNGSGTEERTHNPEYGRRRIHKSGHRPGFETGKSFQETKGAEGQERKGNEQDA